MSGPYVSFRVNRTSRAILTQTIKYEPDPMVSFTNPFEWLIVCDSADKVVIRALEDGRQTLAVIAIAQLRGQRLEVRRQVDHALPTPALWTWLEAVVIPTRELGRSRGCPDAFDAAELSPAPPPAQASPEEVWQMAAGMLPIPPVRPSFVPAPPPTRPSFVPATPSPSAPVAPPAAPLWGPVAAQAMAAANGRYLEFLFDHVSVMVIADAVRYVPDPSLRPSGRYQMKLACDPQGQVSIQCAGDEGMITIALAQWRDSALSDRKQQGGEPDDFQWIALEDALRGELSRAP